MPAGTAFSSTPASSLAKISLFSCWDWGEAPEVVGGVQIPPVPLQQTKPNQVTLKLFSAMTGEGNLLLFASPGGHSGSAFPTLPACCSPHFTQPLTYPAELGTLPGHLAPALLWVPSTPAAPEQQKVLARVSTAPRQAAACKPAHPSPKLLPREKRFSFPPGAAALWFVVPAAHSPAFSGSPSNTEMVFGAQTQTRRAHIWQEHLAGPSCPLPAAQVSFPCSVQAASEQHPAPLSPAAACRGVAKLGRKNVLSANTMPGSGLSHTTGW